MARPEPIAIAAAFGEDVKRSTDWGANGDAVPVWWQPARQLPGKQSFGLIPVQRETRRSLLGKQQQADKGPTESTKLISMLIAAN